MPKSNEVEVIVRGTVQYREDGKRVVVSPSDSPQTLPTAVADRAIAAGIAHATEKEAKPKPE